jgi:hypothetical protein
MKLPYPALAAVILGAAMADLHSDRPLPQETEAEREERLRALDAERRYQRANAERYEAERKAEQDAIAAPYREARRLRNLKKLQRNIP